MTETRRRTKPMRPLDARGVFAFALLAAFAILSLLTVVIGARVYQRVEARAAQANETRMTLGYLAGKLRANDAKNAVAVETRENMEVLTLSRDYGGKWYNTYIYCYNGTILEYFAAADVAFSPAFGETIGSASSLAFEQNGEMLVVTVENADGETFSLSVCLSSGKAGGEA